MKNLSFLPKVILFAIITLFINACHKEETVLTNDIAGNWKVISFVDNETSIIITKTEDNTWNQFNNGDITVSFIKSDLTSGVISGRNVTNTFSGNYTTDSKCGISIRNVIWTEINEPEWGRLFHSITEAESYVIENDQLVIFYNQKKNSITFDKVDE